MTNINVERMSVNATGVGDIAWPELPEVPIALRYRYPAFQVYHENMQNWWQKMKPQLENLALAVKKQSE